MLSRLLAALFSGAAFFMSPAFAEVDGDNVPRVPIASVTVKSSLFDIAFKACLSIGCQDGHGSAFYIGGDYFLTAGHVGNAIGDRTAFLKRRDGRVFTAKVVWVATQSDWALLKSDNPITGLTAPKLTCSAPDVGADISTIGSPVLFDFLQVYGKTAGQEQDVEGGWKKAVITDLSIAPGNSGGPVFNSDSAVFGNLVGALTANPNLSVVEPLSKICSILPAGIVLATK